MKIIEFEKIAQMLAREHKIKILEGRGWAANIKNRDVFYVKNDIYNLPEEHILGLLLHEVAHVHYTTDVKLPDKNKELSHSCLNMLEDISIENIIAGDYPNAGEILESTKTEVLDTLVKMLPTLKASIYEKSLLYAAARFEGRGYTFGIDPYEKLGNQVTEIMLRHKKEIFERKQTKDLLPIVEKIIKLILKEAGEPTAEQKREMMENSQQGNATQSQEQEKAKGQIIKALKGGKGWKEGITMSSQVTFVDEISDQASKIGKQLRTVLKRNNAMEFGGRYRSGKLLTKRFIRIAVLKDRHPFARRIVKSNQSYAFAIASDVSGSMFSSGDKVNSGSYALSAMHMVGEALRYAAIPRAMIVFGARARAVAQMGKGQIRWEQIANENDLQKAGNSSTYIDKAIDACTKELSKIKAERKIMIVLTDGSSDLCEMQEAHKRAVAANIECLSITIGAGRRNYMDETFSKEKNTNIEDTSNTSLIGKAFIDILKTSVATSV